MKKKFTMIFAGLAVMGLVFSAQATTERGTPDEAITMVKKAGAFLKANGKEKMFAEVSNPTGQFVKGDLYVFVHDLEGNCLAHGGNPKLIGKNLLDLKD